MAVEIFLQQRAVLWNKKLFDFLEFSPLFPKQPQQAAIDSGKVGFVDWGPVKGALSLILARKGASLVYMRPHRSKGGMMARVFMLIFLLASSCSDPDSIHRGYV